MDSKVEYDQFLESYVEESPLGFNGGDKNNFRLSKVLKQISESDRDTQVFNKDNQDDQLFDFNPEDFVRQKTEG